jgi:hypothetical protein
MHGPLNVNFLNMLTATFVIQKYKGNTFVAFLWQLFLYKLATILAKFNVPTLPLFFLRESN